MSFAFPLAFLLLLLPLLVRLLPPTSARGGLRVPAHVFDTVTPSHRPARSQWLAGAAWFLLTVAVAGPQVSRTSDLLPASGLDIVLALDLSGSMLKEDFALNGEALSRLDAVKRVASGFVANRKSDRIGLVIFGDQAYFAQALTFDVTAVAHAISEAQVGISGRATAISDGLGLAMKRLATSDARSRVIVLLSDGVDTSGEVNARDAARLAAEHGIRIHTIALGPADLETQPKSRDAVDTATLRDVARIGNGTSFRVRDMADLQAMAVELNKLEPNAAERPPMRYLQSLWFWVAGLALVPILLLGWRRG